MILLIALLLAQAPPERVVMVARPHEKPSILSRAGDAIGKAWHRLYEKDDEQVASANALAAEGRPDAALHEYDAARERLKGSPELAYDRSTALVKSDPEKAPEAASEAAQALQHGDASLRQKAAYQLGVAQEAMGKPDDAMKSYATALSMNPDDEDAKVNLELLLKTQEERKQNQPQAQPQKDKQQSQQKKDEQQQSKGGEDKSQKPQDQQQQGKQQEKQQAQQQQSPDQQQAKPEEKKEQAQAAEKPVDRSEAERLLDALRASEKNLQTWRFAKEKRKNAPRVEAEKDW
jgi:hypothetical protein